MTILYIYPHPDDESFGPAHVMACQRRQGHAVHLLTLTRGGATRQRHALGLSVTEMGEVRYREMRCVERELGLTGMTVLDLPDSGLAGCDPRIIEQAVAREIELLRPDVVVTYPVHGISGFPDHLTAHAVVKRVFCEMRERHGYPRRLAFSTITEKAAASFSMFRLTGSKAPDIDCVVTVGAEDIAAINRALDCYVTYRETVENSNIREHITAQAVFELFAEQFDPPLTDLFERLP